MGKIWLTSDTHYAHDKVIQFCNRPYSTVEEMNEDLVAKWNERVRPGDICYHLGDVGIGNRREWEQYIRRLNGYKIVVRGNHDPTKQALLEAGFNEAVDQTYFIYEGVTFWLAHVPRVNTSDKRRLVRPDPVSPYEVPLCGHVHCSWKVHESGEINVGVDQWSMAPVSVETVLNTHYEWFSHTPPVVVPGA